MRKILIGLFLGLILNVGYFGWEFQDYLYFFFEPCQMCNNEELMSCDYCKNGFELENCNQCINGKLSIDCANCTETVCEKCNGLQTNIEDFCFSCMGTGLKKSCDLCNNGKISGTENCLNCNGTAKIKTNQPCLHCDGEGQTICIGCVKGCFECRGTGKKDCFFCIKGINDGDACFICDRLGYEICQKCEGKGNH